MLGVEHILGGVDHLLFVLSLLLIVRGFKRIAVTITAFTIAHSLTLAAATLGFVHVPGPPVEASIALSIVFVAAEVVRGRRGTPGLTARAPWVVAFTFGLLHGFGFASALAAVGLPQKAIPLALFTFNVGVEIGQLLFVGAVLDGRRALRSTARAPAALERVGATLRDRHRRDVLGRGAHRSVLSRAAPQGAIVSAVTSQPASIPPGSIWPRSSPTSASMSRLSLSFIAMTSSRCCARHREVGHLVRVSLRVEQLDVVQPI